MEYKQVLNFIHDKEKLGSVFGLEAINELLFRLGNPQKGIKAIHIAGTNGKGSIMAFIESALCEAGYRVGRYISPTIFDYRERWQLNKKWASEDEVSKVMTIISDVVSQMINDGYNSPTAFEIETAAAFYMFRDWNVDYMLIECGMGGRLDATNVIEEDVLNILASISLDHMQVLGDNVADITKEKLGIVRKGSELVTYPQIDEVSEVIKNYASDNEVELYKPDVNEIKIIEEDIHGSKFSYKQDEFRICMGGQYQILNAVTAIEALKTLSIDIHFIKKGFEKTRWDGRYQVINENPVVIVDGAHNEDAWLRLRDSLEKDFDRQKIVFITGVLADKEYDKMLEILVPLTDMVYTVQSTSPRALPKEKLAELYKSKNIKAVPMNTVTDALKEAVKQQSVIVVCGSLTIMGEAIRYFDKADGE